MKNSIKVLVAVVLLCSIISSGCSSTKNIPNNKEVLLRYTPKKGDVYKFNMVYIMKMGGAQSMDMTVDVDLDNTIGEIFSDKSFYSTSVINRMKMNMKAGFMNLEYDSDSDLEEKDMDAVTKIMHKAISGFIGVDLKSKMSNLGKVLETPDYDKIFKDNPSVKEQMNQSSNMTKAANIHYPKEKVSVGNTWNSKVKTEGKTPTILNTTYTVKEITTGFVTLSLTGDILFDSDAIEGSGTLIGSMVISRETGFVKSMEMIQKMEMEVSEMTFNVVNDIKIEVTKK